MASVNVVTIFVQVLVFNFSGRNTWY